MDRPLRVLHVASECAPFAKTGGLGDVVGSLPIAQQARGIDARVVLPLYRTVPRAGLERLPPTLVVPMGGFTAYGALYRGHLAHSAAPVYFVEHQHYFERDGIYGDARGDFGDNVERFAFLCRAAFAVCRAEGFLPDVIHAHDWQGALSLVFTNTVEWGTAFHSCATVLSIHNMGYQGVFDPRDLAITGLGNEHLHGDELEHFGTLNLLKGGIVHANQVLTVSPTYAQEIQTREHGAGLEGVVRAKASQLRGILNGVDMQVWNPRTDPRIAARFSAEDLSGKAICKAMLQREAGLPEQSRTPLFGIITRLTPQKGMDLLVSILPTLLELDLQLVVLGTGDPKLERAFQAAAWARPHQVAAAIQFDDALAHRIEAGCDFFLMPSRYEPCGMNQLYSLLYGALPIVHRTGGLADTVWSFEERTGNGTGFVIDELNPRSLFDGIGWAQSTYFQRPGDIDRMRRLAMSQDFSWDRSAAEYEKAYWRALTLRHPR